MASTALHKSLAGLVGRPIPLTPPLGAGLGAENILTAVFRGRLSTKNGPYFFLPSQRESA